MIRFTSVIFAVMVAQSAFGQSPAITQPLIIRGGTNNFDDPIRFGPSRCGETVRLTWTYTPSLGTACSELTLWSTAQSSCGDGPASGDVTYPSVSQVVLVGAKTGAIDVKLVELPGFVSQTLSDGGVTNPVVCGAPDTLVEHLICGSATSGGLTGCFNLPLTPPKMRASPMKLVFDTKPPTAPVIVEENATNESATITFEKNTDAAFVVATATEVVEDGGAPDPVESPKAAATQGTVKVTDLTNNRTYSVQLHFIDAADNVGPKSEPVLVTPIPTVGFWGAYQRAGGTDQGGCSISLGLMPILAAAWFIIRSVSR